jgi:hypothetical protein
MSEKKEAYRREARTFLALNYPGFDSEDIERLAVFLKERDDHRAQPLGPCPELSVNEKAALAWAEDESLSPAWGGILARLVHRLLPQAKPCPDCARKYVAEDDLADAIDGIRDFACCDSSSKFCGWEESVGEVVSAFDALSTPPRQEKR